MSFLKFIKAINSELDVQWSTDPESAYRHASLDVKCSFVLEQAIMLSYLDYLYDHEHITLVRQYREQFVRWYYSDIKALSTNDPSNKLLKSTYINASILLGLTAGRVSYDECAFVLQHSNSVTGCCEQSFYEPYLKYKENVCDLASYVENEQMARSRSFSVSGNVTLPSFKIKGHYITVSYEITFPSYSFEYNYLKELVADQIQINSIFTFWSGYNWRGANVTGVMGVFAAQCLTHDINAIPKKSLMRGYLEIYNRVIPHVTVTGYLSTSQALSSETTIQRRMILHFLIYVRKKFNVKFDDMNIIAEYTTHLENDDDRLLKTYLTEPDPSNISAEAYAAFQRSCFSSFEEFSLRARAEQFKVGNYRNAKGDNASGNPQDSPNGTETPQETAPDSKDDTTDDGLKALESPTGIQDSSDDDKSNDNNSETADKPDNEPNAEADKSTDESKDKLPPLPKVSDKHGVKLKLSEGESPDTVLYREEIKSFIDSLLANPPSYLSVQTISAIKRLRANWMYLLDVQSLHDFLEALIRLPKTLNIKKKR